MTLLLILFALILLGEVIILFALGGQMSKTADLTAAVDKVLAYIVSLQNAPVTPDAEVQAQVDRLNAAVPQPPQP